MIRVERITSAQNPLFKSIRRAGRTGELAGDGCCIVEGARLVEEAVRSGRPIAAVVAAEAALPLARRLAGEHVRRIIVTPASVFQSLATTETPQGLLALVAPPVWTLADVFGPEPLVLVLDGIQDPGNAGTMIRAAEAFGASGVVLLKGSVNPYNPKAVRASAGSIFRIPLIGGVAPEEFLRAASEAGITVYAAATTGGQPADASDLVRPCAIVIGSEGHGVSRSFRGNGTLHIPTSGVESLNAAVAAAILLYEARRQRGGFE